MAGQGSERSPHRQRSREAGIEDCPDAPNGEARADDDQRADRVQPPRSYAFRVIDGPVRALGKGRFEPLDNGARTLFTFELDFEGHGIGKVLVPLIVRRQAANELPQSHANLKRVLEGGA